MIFQGANPFPNCENEAQAIILMGTAFFSALILILLMVFMIYLYTKIKKFLPILLVFLFSLIIGMLSISSLGIPFTPWVQIFFLLFQTTIFYQFIDEGGIKNLWSK